MTDIPVRVLPSSCTTLGADPEFFVFDKGKLVPAYTFLPEKGHIIQKAIVKPQSPWENRPAVETPVFWDGFQGEFSYNQAPKCIGLMGVYTANNIRALSAAVKKHSSTAKLSLQNTVRIPEAHLKSALDPYVALGCMPSENAYGMHGIDVENPRTLKYRFAGGHMHFGGIPKTIRKRIHFIKMLDKIAGVWAVGAAQNIDIPLRRKYYGLAGEFRPTSYPQPTYRIPESGIEYRTLSNFYYCHPAIHQLMWEIARSAVYLARTRSHELWAMSDEDAIGTINNCDVPRAKVLMKLNEPLFRWMLGSRGWSIEMQDLAVKIGQEGLECVIKHPDEIEENWSKVRCTYGEFSATDSFRVFVRNLTQ